MSSAAIFDLDGTLVYFPINYEAMYGEFKRIMHTEVVRPVTATIPRLDEPTKREVFAAWDRAELAVAEKVTANEEGMRLYREHTGVPRALVTMQGKKAVDAVASAFGLRFDAVVTREDGLNRAEQLLLAAKKLGVGAGEVLFVGNADSDAAAAEKVGCRFLRVR
jgi:HAD superfamily hydrolase (TIGR01549 family)